MKERFYKTNPLVTDPRKFGGIIYPSDFNTDYRGKNNTDGSLIAKRILSDSMFDRQCRMNRENRERNATENKKIDQNCR